MGLKSFFQEAAKRVKEVAEVVDEALEGAAEVIEEFFDDTAAAIEDIPIVGGLLAGGAKAIGRGGGGILRLGGA